MATPKYNTYVGMRYVPIFDGEWDRTKTYEPLIIVSNQGNSYTSRTFVPTGVDITNETYWALTGNYNAQVEYYRQETARVAEEVDLCIHYYDNIASMQADTNLQADMICYTSGYYNINDCGGGFYIVKSSEPSEYYEALSNGLYAELIVDNYINPMTFGAHGDGNNIDNVPLNNYFNACQKHNIEAYGFDKTYLIDNSTASLCGHYGVTINGGINVKGFVFKLASDCPDMTTLISCKYDGVKYSFEDCVFEGVLRTITSGTEDGGNHGVIFCNGVTMFPSDWQDFADINFKNCSFINIQSYGIFPTPIKNKLTVKDCYFNCHAVGILSYAIDTNIIGCAYENADGANTTVRALATDEIENFTSPTNIKKNILFKDCESASGLYFIQHGPQRGIAYGEVNIIRCFAHGSVIHTFDEPSYSINFDIIRIDDCSSDGSGDGSLFLDNANGNVKINRLTGTTKIQLRQYGGTIEFTNCTFNDSIRLAGTSTFDNLRVVNCVFDGTPADGYFTSRWGSTYPQCNRVDVIGCTCKSNKRILYGINAANVYVNGLVGASTPIMLIYNQEAQTTNVYVEGLIMPQANADWTYFAENIGGNCIIRGMSAGINTNGITGTVTKDITTI